VLKTAKLYIFYWYHTHTYIYIYIYIWNGFFDYPHGQTLRMFKYDHKCPSGVWKWPLQEYGILISYNKGCQNHFKVSMGK